MKLFTDGKQYLKAHNLMSFEKIDKIWNAMKDDAVKKLQTWQYIIDVKSLRLFFALLVAEQ